LPIGRGRIHCRSVGAVLHPGRENLETLERIRASAGSRIFEAQYQQSPVPAEGNLFRSAWLRRYSVASSHAAFTQIVQSWDTASKLGADNDYSVGTTWGIQKNTYYLLDVYRERREFPDLLRTVIAQAEDHDANAVLIEDANSGAALIQSLRQQSSLNLVGVRPILDKMTRAVQQSTAFESGRVFLPEAAPWLAEFEKELLAFPNGRHDDQVDSTVQFLQWASARTQHSGTYAAPIITFHPRSDVQWQNT
jgi:predicted phage terminase large subunit-like protein